MRMTVWALVAAVVLAGCASGPGAAPAPPGEIPSAPTAPTTDWSTASYRFTLDSTCGERLFLGTFHVTVEDGKVTLVEPEAPIPEVPTIADLLQRAQADGLAAPSEFHLDPTTGVPTVVEFEGDPNAIDDEECYAVSDYEPLG